MISTSLNDSEAAYSWEDSPHIPSISINTNNKDTTKTDTDDDDDDDTYIQATATATCPPLVKLQFYGMCCPFIETEEEYDARIGYSNLQNYPITWYKKELLSDFANDDAKGIAPSLIDGIGQLFKSGGAASTISNDSSKRITMSYIGVMATLTIVDTDNHGPVLQIRSLDGGWNDPTNEAAQNAVKEYITNGKPWWEDECVRDKPPSKVIPLYMIDKVASGFSLIGDSTAGGVKLYGTPTSKGFLSGSAAPELLRFDTLGGGGNSWSDDAPWSSSKPNEPVSFMCAVCTAKVYVYVCVMC